jgi:hypothetical protein
MFTVLISFHEPEIALTARFSLTAKTCLGHIDCGMSLVFIPFSRRSKWERPACHFLSDVGLCWKVNLWGGFTQSVGRTQRSAAFVMIFRWQQHEQDL